MMDVTICSGKHCISEYVTYLSVIMFLQQITDDSRF